MLRLVSNTEKDVAIFAKTETAQTHQLVLPGTEGLFHAGLILSSFRSLLRLGVDRALLTYKPVLIVDVRAAPTFVPYKSRFDDFEDELRGLGIEYWHAEQLVPGLLEQNKRREQYASQLREHADVLRQLGYRALINTVLLISSDPRSQGSDRDTIVAELHRLLGKQRLQVMAV